jgi:hypothetical protein
VVLLVAGPAFDFFFARDGVPYVKKHFVVNEAKGPVLRRESFAALSMLGKAVGKVIGDACVERPPRNAGEHVDEVAALFSHDLILRSGRRGGVVGCCSFFTLVTGATSLKGKAKAKTKANAGSARFARDDSAKDKSKRKNKRKNKREVRSLRSG